MGIAVFSCVLHLCKLYGQCYWRILWISRVQSLDDHHLLCNSNQTCFNHLLAGEVKLREEAFD